MLLDKKCLLCQQKIRKLYYMIHHWLKSSSGKLKHDTVRGVCQTFVSKWHFRFKELCHIIVLKKRLKETSFTEVISYCTRYGVNQMSRSTVKESYYYGNVLLSRDYKLKKNTIHSPITVNLTCINLSLFFLFHTIFDKNGRCIIKTNILIRGV